MLKRLFRKKEKPQSISCTLVLVAAGSASRMDGQDKIFCDLCGTPVLIHSLRPFEASSLIGDIIIVTRRESLVAVAELCKLYGLTKVSKILPGGQNRSDSVQLGVLEVSDRVDLIAIHDGARPLVTVSVLEEVIRTASEYGAAAPGIPVKDTIKSVAGGLVQETPPRDSLRAIQTPQVFEPSLLRAALAKAKQDAVVLTDDCSAVEHLGFPVVVTQGDEENIKLTVPGDLMLAENILDRRSYENRTWL